MGSTEETCSIEVVDVFSTRDSGNMFSTGDSGLGEIRMGSTNLGKGADF